MQTTNITAKPIAEVIAAIEALDLTSVKLRLMDRELGEGWTGRHADQIESAYKNFLAMIVRYQEHAEDIMLAKHVDEFWHTHILQTMKYAADCERVFGQFLHHEPHVGEVTAADLEKRERQAEKTRTLYEREFGSATNAAWAGDVDPPQAAFSGVALAAKDAAFSGVALSAAASAFSGVAAKAQAAAFSGVAVEARSAAFSGAAVNAADAAFSGVAVKAANAAFSGVAVKAANAAFSGVAVQAANAGFSGVAVKAANAAFPGVAVKPENSAFSGVAAPSHDPAESAASPGA
jgi:hypothetical protein